jgi:hypothetical protein
LAKAINKNPKKECLNKYNEKFAVNGSLAGVFTIVLLIIVAIILVVVLKIFHFFST